MSQLNGKIRKATFASVVALHLALPSTSHAGIGELWDSFWSLFSSTPAPVESPKPAPARPATQIPQTQTEETQQMPEQRPVVLERLGGVDLMTNHPPYAVASLRGVEFDKEALAQNMVPRGSAVATTSGALADTGITMIIHAATGAMTQSGGFFEPTLESVGLSIKNSLWLARKAEHKRVAIPFIGGSIFLGRIGTTADKLSDAIVEAALDAKKSLELRFVIYPGRNSEYEMNLFKDALLRRGIDPTSEEVQVVQGSIMDFSLHGASAIINAANMEVMFGGGLSGAIAQATQNSVAIDEEAAGVIQLVKEQLNVQ